MNNQTRGRGRPPKAKQAAPTPTPTPAPVIEPAKTVAFKSVEKTEETFMVETTGNFQLHNVFTNEMIPHDKPVSARRTDPFVNAMLANNKLREVK